MAEIRLSTQERTEFGKGFARRARAAGKVPGVVYGHGESVRHVLLPGHDLMIALRTPNVLLNLEFDSGSRDRFEAGLLRANRIRPRHECRKAINTRVVRRSGSNHTCVDIGESDCDAGNDRSGGIMNLSAEVG